MTDKSHKLPDCMMPDGAEPCFGYQQLMAAHAKLESEVEHWKKDWMEDGERIRLRAENEKATTLCGQLLGGQHEAEVELVKLRAENERLAKLVYGERAKLAAENERLTKACEEYDQAAATIADENERMRQALRYTVDLIDANSNAFGSDLQGCIAIARAELKSKEDK